MIEQQPLAVGTRVCLRSPSRLVTLRSNLGRIARPDVWDGYYIVELDQPAIYHEADGSSQELTEIREAVDNLDVVSSEASNIGRLSQRSNG